MIAAMTSTISVAFLSAYTEASNSFYKYYIEMCKRKNCHPLSIAIPTPIQNYCVLNFVVDRVSKAEEWYSIIQALRFDTTLKAISLRSTMKEVEFLHNVSSEASLYQSQRKNELLWTDYIFKALIKSLSLCLKQNPCLATLELNGITLYPKYSKLLLKGISSNNTLINLSLKGCSIGDSGCTSLCKILKKKSNIEILNLSCCELGSLSAKEIAELIDYHQNSRLIVRWQNSLRYSNFALPESAATGLKRITLNNNLEIGDKGLRYIIDKFINEECIKALDMQRCGITEDVSKKLLNVLSQNTSLEIADFRCNDRLLPITLNRISTILIQREPHSGPTYQWCKSVSFKTTLALTNPLTSREQTSIRYGACSSKMPDDDCKRSNKLRILNDRLKEKAERNKLLRSTYEELKELNRKLEDGWKELQNLHPDVVDEVNDSMNDRLPVQTATDMMSANGIGFSGRSV